MTTKFLSRILLLLCLLLVSCKTDLTSRYSQAEDLASAHGFTKTIIVTDKFPIVSYQRLGNSKNDDDIVFYIEGDGLAFTNMGGISDNPTPLSPILLNLATQDSRPNIIYLARPCQYIDLSFSEYCTAKYWTNERMSEEVVHAMSYVINNISQNRPVSLIGFSGGGGIAILVSPYINNLKNIITIAGNLDIEEFTKFHKVSPMQGSLNPINYIDQVVNIPQIHLIGSNDKIVPKNITKKFSNKVGICSKYIEIYNTSHSTGWDKQWKDILHIPIECN